MIRIGLAGWGDHDALYPDAKAKRNKLATYSRYFPAVEVDSSFYAVQSPRLFARWGEETPAHFRFVVKAHQAMTGHQRGAAAEADPDRVFDAFRESVQPLVEQGKLAMILFQYPPWFDCVKDHVQALRRVRERYRDLPLALEFRHRSWFEAGIAERTLAFMREEGWIHSVCDEPQAGEGSIPIVAVPTHDRHTLVRFHGRNAQGWNSRDAGAGWREVRYLYRYSADELREWAERVRALEARSGTVDVVFNNNSGGDAADNAFMFMELLGLDGPRPPKPERPEQLELFE